MKKILILILLTISLLVAGSCSPSAPMKKPFIIVATFQRTDRTWYYMYQDAEGTTQHFDERDRIYHMGDTLK